MALRDDLLDPLVMPSGHVRFHREGTIGHLVLDRPDKLNAQTFAMWEDLRDLGAAIGQDTTLRCLLVRGEGASFSAGLDLAAIADSEHGLMSPTMNAGQNDSELQRWISDLQRGFTWMHAAPYPTIAAVQGHAYGAGFQLALACDLRVFADDAMVGVLEPRWGLIPDLGATEALPRLVGRGRALQMILLAERIDALEAHQLGIANWLVPVEALQDTTREVAQRLARQPRASMAWAKAAVDASYPEEQRSFDVAGRGQAACIRSDDFAEAMTALTENRAPVYHEEEAS